MSTNNYSSKKCLAEHSDQTWLDDKLQKIILGARDYKKVDRLCSVVQPKSRAARYTYSCNQNTETKERYKTCSTSGSGHGPHDSQNCRTMCGNGRSNLAGKIAFTRCVSGVKPKTVLAGHSQTHARGGQRSNMVVAGPGWLEWKTNQATKNRCADHDRCISHRLGCVDDGSKGSRLLGQIGKRTIVEPQGTSRGLYGASGVSGQCRQKVGANSVGQCNNDSIFEPPRGPNTGIDSTRKINMGVCVQKQHGTISPIFSGKRECIGGQPVETEPEIRVAATSTVIQVHRQSMGSSYHRQVCNNVQYPNQPVQQPVCRPIFSGSRRVSANRLDARKQLLCPAISAHCTSVRHGTSTKSNSNHFGPVLASTAMVSKAQTNVHSAPTGTDNGEAYNLDNASFPRTIAQQEVETLGMEDMWESRLRELNWPQKAINYFKYAWATSTRNEYSRHLVKLNNFCSSKDVPFPPTSTDIMAEFLCGIAEKSTAPRSVLKCTLAACTSMYDAYSLPNPAKTPEIVKLISALVKSTTSRPMIRSTVMPLAAFSRLFVTLGGNNELPIDMLRLKAITLLTIATMARPSDLSPKGKFVDPNNREHHLVLGTDQLKFYSDGSLEVTFFGIKNDTSRKGFVVHLPPVTNSAISVVDCLQVYIDRTQVQRLCVPGKPLFISLTAPYKAISSSTVANQLTKAINLAGMGGQGFTAKSFRPSAATAAIASGCDPHVARKVGRWENAEVFFGHYVHSKPSHDYLDVIFESDGTF